MTPATILVVEDQRVVARDIGEQLTRLGYSVLATTSSGEEAIQLAEQLHPDLVLMDIRLEGPMDGVEAALHIRERYQLPVVYLTAYADEETLRRAKVTEPFGYVLKPFQERELRTAIEIGLYKHHAERKLFESEKRYAVTLSSIGDAVIATNNQGQITFMNPVAEALTGWSHADANGYSIEKVFRIINEHSLQPAENPAAKVLREGIVVGLANHTLLLPKDGGEVPIDDSGAPIVDDHGSILGVVLVFHDVTHQRRAEEKLHEQAERLRLAVQASDVGLWDWNFLTNQVVFSPEWKSQLGYEDQEVGADYSEWETRLHPDDLDPALKVLHAYLDGQSPEYAVEFRLRHKDGSYRWIYSRGEVVRDTNGKPVRMLGCHLDITEQKQAEASLRASEARFRTLVDHATDAFFLHDEHGVILDVNRQACKSLGYSREELIGLTPYVFDLDADRSFLSQLGARLDTGEMIAFDTRHRRKDGTTFPVEVRVRPFWEDGKRFAVSLSRDITERLRAQEDLAAREMELRSLAESSPGLMGTFYLRPDGSVCMPYTSSRIWELFGLRSEEVVEDASVLLGRTHPDDAKLVWETIAQSGRSMTPWRLEYRVLHPTRGEIWVEGSFNPKPHPDGGVIWYGFVHDITERKRAQQALILFRALIDRTNDAIEVFDPETGRFLDVNEKACIDHGYTREEYLALRVSDLDSTKGNPIVWAENIEYLRRFGFRVHEGQHRRKDGSVFPVEINVNYVRLDRDYMIAVVRDITERKGAEQALIESHSLLNAVVEGTTDAVFVKDLQGRYLMINSAGARFLGKSVEEVVGKHDRELFTPDSAENVLESDRQVMATGQSQVFEETATAANVTRTYLVSKGVYRDHQGKIIGLIGISRDITELKRLEQQFLQAQKMDAVGRLAGGVAHDFNNLLTVINGYSELIFNTLRPDDPNCELLTEIQKAGDRAANLTRQLLAFSRKQVLQPRFVNLNILLNELLKLLKRLIGEDIELTFTPNPRLGLAKIDPGLFEQAIINLAVNARDAMPQGGRLSIETHNAEIDKDFTRSHPEVRSSRYVMISVSDSGHGMDLATKSRIFEPFFTTKAPGKGTGLGLAMVYGFVKQSGGDIEVVSELGNGTTFKVYLPVAEELIPSTKSDSDTLKISKGTETVLLVEDEDAVRSLSRLILQSSGYTVLEARNGQEAMWVAQQHQGTIHILVTDLVMPRMNGRQLADLLGQIRPQMKILFMSGYTDEAVLRHGVSESTVAFLQKPFSPIGLARKVREVLDTRENRP
jgi:two-component system, cell cycle sensor histidine kinase and response regulator CckA